MMEKTQEQKIAEENEKEAAREALRKMSLKELYKEEHKMADIIANSKTKKNEYFQREEQRIREEIKRKLEEGDD